MGARGSGRGIVQGQEVDPRLAERAREFRREMTPEERVLWQELRGGRLGARFRRQQVIGRYIADFYCAAAGLVVEVDGSVHAAQVEEDIARTPALQERGLMVLRFTNAQVRNNLNSVRARIAEIVETRLTPDSTTQH